jgi:hypothetical protein
VNLKVVAREGCDQGRSPGVKFRHNISEVGESRG